MTASEVEVGWQDLCKLAEVMFGPALEALYEDYMRAVYRQPRIMWLMTEGDMPGIGEGGL